MQQIVLITDYQNRFGTKYTALPYRSGMDKGKLSDEFEVHGIEAVFCRAATALEKFHDPAGIIFLYTSSEDTGDFYKSFIEDVVHVIESMNGIVIPHFLFLRAHNNKVFMELLKKGWGREIDDRLSSANFGSYEEFIEADKKYTFPVVVKRPGGFKSRGVYLARNEVKLKKLAYRISKTTNFRSDIKDYLRKFIHKGFVPESRNRSKFLIQQFVPGLQNDWKVLIYNEKYYVLKRMNRKDDFRASGSGLLSYPVDFPEGLLDFAGKAFTHFNVPNISLDIAYNGESFFILEAQFLYFGTYTIENAPYYFSRDNNRWSQITEKSVLEQEYVRSVVAFLQKNNLVK